MSGQQVIAFVARLRSETNAFIMRVGLTLKLLRDKQDWFDDFDAMLDCFGRQLFDSREILNIYEEGISMALDNIGAKLNFNAAVKQHLKDGRNLSQVENILESIKKVCNSFKDLRSQEAGKSAVDEAIEWSDEILGSIDKYQQGVDQSEVDKLLDAADTQLPNQMYQKEDISDCCRETMSKLKTIVVKASIPGLLVDAEYLRQCSPSEVEEYLSEQRRYVDSSLANVKKDLKAKKEKNQKMNITDFKNFNARIVMIKMFGEVIEGYRQSFSLTNSSPLRTGSTFQSKPQIPTKPFMQRHEEEEGIHLLPNLIVQGKSRDNKSWPLSPRYSMPQIHEAEVDEMIADTSTLGSESRKLLMNPKGDRISSLILTTDPTDCQKLDFSDSESFEAAYELNPFFNKVIDNDEFTAYISYFEGVSKPSLNQTLRACIRLSLRT